MLIYRFLFLSTMIHLLVIFISILRFQKNIDEPLLKDSNSHFSLRMKKQTTSAISSIKKESLTEYESSEDSASIKQEIQALQNSIQYPPDALEQGLESDCEWRIVVGELGKYEKLELTKPCTYRIFEDEVKRSIKEWKFSSPEGTVMDLPIRFRIIKE